MENNHESLTDLQALMANKEEVPMNTPMKMAIAAGSLVISTAIATPQGPYVGTELGFSDSNNTTSNFQNSLNQRPQAGAVTDTTGFGARAFVGYRFIKYLAAEAGFSYFANANANDMAYDNGTTNISGKIKEHAYDISAKVFYPLAEQVDPFIDLGVAYIDSNSSLSGSNKGKDHSGFAPRYGAGVNFNITKNFATGLSWDRINQTSGIENADLLGLNFTYSFTG
jgi:outer membrane autotransporter protein